MSVIQTLRPSSRSFGRLAVAVLTPCPSNKAEAASACSEADRCHAAPCRSSLPRKSVVISPAMKVGCWRQRCKNPRLVRTPSTVVSWQAMRSFAVLVSRVSPQAMSLAIIES